MTSSISLATFSGSALGRSILLMTGMMREVVLQRQVDVGQRLRLDALRRVHDQDRALAGGQAARDLVGEVHVPRRVDQVELVRLCRRGAYSACARRAP